MKKLKTLIASSILALLFSVTALAGDMQGPGFTNPLPPPRASSLVPGEPTETAVSQQSASDSIAETAIEMMQLFLSIF